MPRESLIWNKLYDFQKDAALAIINKLEKYNGCILADSVGLGKTFSALAVIKYYENRNKNVLVLCPKKLANNWNTFKGNYVNNPIAGDRLRYNVLYHTDLSRTTGMSNGIELGRLRWDTYDLIVIDESHNFRNGVFDFTWNGDYASEIPELLRKTADSVDFPVTLALASDDKEKCELARKAGMTDAVPEKEYLTFRK